MLSAVDRFVFMDWKGTPPPLSQEQGVTFHRPGADGVGQQTTGSWEEAFTVTLVYWDSTYVRALRNIAAMQAFLVRTGPKRVIYENIDYSRPPFSHYYLIDRIYNSSCKQQVRQLYSPTPTISRAGGVEALLEFTMTPHRL